MGKPARMLVLVVCSVSLVFGAVALVSAADPPTYTSNATLAEINDSNITAKLKLVEKGSTLTVTGTANGMDPTKHYHSLIYDSGSSPTGPNACIPSVLPPVGGLSFDQMQLGSWQPIGQTTRTLNATRKGLAFVKLRDIRTLSIRRHDQTGPAASLALVSCGKRGSAVKTP